MKVITVSREYGAGGGEAARRLSEALGWELLDRELLHQAAAVEHVPDADLERVDEKAISMIDRFRLHPPHERYIHGLTEAVRQAAARGNVILVGRGTRQLLGETPNVFHLRLVAPRDWRAKRMAALEGWSPEQALTRTLEVDRTRERFNRYFFGPEALKPEQYDLVVNTGRVPVDEVVAWVVAHVRNDWPQESSPAGKRVLTLADELEACDAAFIPTLAGRLGLRACDRDLLEQEAARLGQLMNELAERGGVLLVGLGGSRFLRDHPRAFHVRLVAPMLVRVRRVMMHRWWRQEPAKKLIDESDTQRRRFYQDHFGADWSDPLEYHVTVNSARLGPTAVDLIAFAAQRFWQRLGSK